jgi:RHS repeat-associated protein
VSIDTEMPKSGKELDSNTGLYYYGARYYDPEIGRFITADSFVQKK